MRRTDFFFAFPPGPLRWVPVGAQMEDIRIWMSFFFARRKRTRYLHLHARSAFLIRGSVGFPRMAKGHLWDAGKRVRASLSASAQKKSYDDEKSLRTFCVRRTGFTSLSYFAGAKWTAAAGGGETRRGLPTHAFPCGQRESANSSCFPGRDPMVNTDTDASKMSGSRFKRALKNGELPITAIHHSFCWTCRYF